ncbi:MAG: hypothetical protein FJW23_00505 [Acidimicrobiia bacterium]|nr:hypothetical protein [Acidimicrobiia bacterium]
MRREEKELHSRKILRGRYMWIGMFAGIIVGGFAGDIVGNMGLALGLGAILGIVVAEALYQRG